jgi:hypothetical protein
MWFENELRPDFMLLTKNSKVVDIGNGEIIFEKGDVKKNPMSISLLLEGQVVSLLEN